MLEFNENDNLSTMDDKIHHWLEHEGKEHWPRFKEIRDSWKGDVELWEELNVWTYHKLVKEIKNDKQAHWSELSQDIQRRIDLMVALLQEALFTAQVLNTEGMVEGIKCDRTHHIRDHIKAVLEHSLEYDRMVDEMLDEFGWQ